MFIELVFFALRGVFFESKFSPSLSANKVSNSCFSLDVWLKLLI